MRMLFRNRFSTKFSSPCFSCVICFVIVLNFVAVYSFSTVFANILNMLSVARQLRQFKDGHINVLLWVEKKSIPKNISLSQCKYSNCDFSKTNLHVTDACHSSFDAVLFDDLALKRRKNPSGRTPSQFYIFGSTESAYDRPACETYNDDFFNWTFTYKLDSTVPLRNFLVENASSGEVVAPKINVDWQVSTDPVKPEVLSWLSRKKKAAAWLVNDCDSGIPRNEYLTKLKEHLLHFSLTIDVFGSCNNRKCDNDDCGRMIREEYYFYMAFENPISEDYVTDRILLGYNNYAVPIVYGGANYSRFLPPGSYLNAKETHPHILAFTISETMKNQSLFENYFKWRNLYNIGYKTTNTSVYHSWCDLCEALNKYRNVSSPAIKDFRLWWNGVNGMKWCLSDDFWYETFTVNVDSAHIMSLY